MESEPQLQVLAREEPWRQGLGQPINALDPTWEPGLRDIPCQGPVEHEPGTRWWVCQSCGFVGSSYTPIHPRAEDPYMFLRSSIDFFLNKKGSSMRAWQTMALVAGTALRYAAVATDVRDYLARLVTR